MLGIVKSNWQAWSSKKRWLRICDLSFVKGRGAEELCMRSWTWNRETARPSLDRRTDTEEGKDAGAHENCCCITTTVFKKFDEGIEEQGIKTLHWLPLLLQEWYDISSLGVYAVYIRIDLSTCSYRHDAQHINVRCCRCLGAHLAFPMHRRELQTSLKCRKQYLS